MRWTRLERVISKFGDSEKKRREGVGQKRNVGMASLGTT